jgi:hypothetical protein
MVLPAVDVELDSHSSVTVDVHKLLDVFGHGDPAADGIRQAVPEELRATRDAGGRSS